MDMVKEIEEKLRFSQGMLYFKIQHLVASLLLQQKGFPVK